MCAFIGPAAAARGMYLSQPAVSQAVRQLEKEAGLSCSCGRQRCPAYKEGELLYRYVKIGVESLLEGEKMVERVLGMDMGEVRIGASDMTLQFS